MFMLCCLMFSFLEHVVIHLYMDFRILIFPIILLIDKNKTINVTNENDMKTHLWVEDRVLGETVRASLWHLTVADVSFKRIPESMQR